MSATRLGTKDSITRVDARKYSGRTCRFDYVPVQNRSMHQSVYEALYYFTNADVLYRYASSPAMLGFMVILLLSRRLFGKFVYADIIAT